MARKKKKIINKDKGTKVKNEDAVRDENSGAIVFNKQSEYQQATRRKRQNLTNKKNNSEIRLLQKQVAQLSLLIEQLMSK